jgi:peptidoglycan/LPS O-acetylase OafA/YrhL
MTTLNRRYDIDWLRVIAIGLLLIYHVAIGFQPWGIMIGFITNDKPWQALWLPMQALNVWRIPFLFFVSGIGVYFAMQQRNWKQLIGERTLRILIPYLFGMVAIFPISTFLLQKYNGWELSYNANPGHLWFLGNIFAYVVVLSPLFYYLKKHQDGKFVVALRKLLSTPLGMVPVAGFFIAEVMIVKPFPYELYAMTWHGFILGFIAFLCGFCFVLCGDSFWKMILQWRWLFFAGAIGLFVVRMFVLGMKNPGYLLVIESQCWILSVFALGYQYLNHGSKTLTYLSQAAYPVYILHMIFLYLASYVIFPLTISVEAKFIIVLIVTFLGCFGAFEIIRRVSFLRPLFGLKFREKETAITARQKTQGFAQVTL